MLKVLSLGAGVQSSCVLLMSDCGLLPKLDAAIFADTGWEPQAVYEHLDWLISEVDIPVHVVARGSNIRSDLMDSKIRGVKKDGNRWASVPLHVLKKDGDRGMIRRQCTNEYKIRPIERFIRKSLLGMRGRATPRDCRVEQWFGISLDEFQRAKPSRVRWKRHAFPLCNFPDRCLEFAMTRQDCLNWLAEHYPGRNFPRSACIGCPYRSNAEWRSLPNAEFHDAVEVDNAVRKMSDMRGEVYLHKSCTPLERVDLEREQMGLWPEECAGVCNV